MLSSSTAEGTVAAQGERERGRNIIIVVVVVVVVVMIIDRATRFQRRAPSAHAGARGILSPQVTARGSARFPGCDSMGYADW